MFKVLLVTMQELEWISSHPKDVERYSGKWVAVTKSGVVASGDSISEIEVSLKERGIKLDEVMLMKVPRKDEELSIL